MADARDKLRAIARRWIEEGWQKGNVAVVHDLHAPSFVDRGSAGRPSDNEGFAGGIRQLYAAFPDFYAIIEDLVVDVPAARVAVRWSATGTHRGPFMDIPPTGKTVAFSGIEIIRAEADRIVERWGEWDGTRRNCAGKGTFQKGFLAVNKTIGLVLAAVISVAAVAFSQEKQADAPSGKAAAPIAASGEAKMYGMIVKIIATPGDRDKLIEILLGCAGKMPGCLSYIIAKDPTNADVIWVTEVWESQKSHDASESLPAVQEAVARGMPLVAKFEQKILTEPVGGHGLTPSNKP